MISHELAQQLKDAGFPQYPGIPEKSKEIFGGSPFAPTFSELIEACGERFSSLYSPLTGTEWKAFGWKEFKRGGELQGEGSTPEEAVARLWLALNKK